MSSLKGPRIPGKIGNFSKLSKDSQSRLDRMFESTNLVSTARTIGIIPVTVEKMLYGGTAKPESIAKVEDWMRVNA